MFELPIFYTFYAPHGFWLEMAVILSFIGSGWTTFAIAALASYRKLRPTIWRLVAALLGVAVFVFAIKSVVRRARPCNSLPNVHALCTTPLDPSFPSGHSAGAFAVATFVALQPRVPLFVKCALYVIALGIAWSRVALGVHFPTDIFCGGILGAALAFATQRLFTADKAERVMS